MSFDKASGRVSLPDPLAAARRLADGLLFPRALETDRSPILSRDLLDAIATAGLYGLAGPEAPPAEVGREVVETMAGGCLTTTFVWMQHHRAVRAAAAAGGELRRRWLDPLCRGEVRAGVAFSQLRRRGPPALTAAEDADGWVIDGVAPWVTGWGRIDVLHAAAREGSGQIVWSLLDAREGPTLSVEPLNLAAVSASATVTVRFSRHRVPPDRVVAIEPYDAWAARDATELRQNASLALGVARRCSSLLATVRSSEAQRSRVPQGGRASVPEVGRAPVPEAGGASLSEVGPGPLAEDIEDCRRALDSAGPGEMSEARARASELVMRAATALVVSGGGRSMLLDQHAQRLAREALFLQVFGQTASIRGAQMRRLGIDRD